MCLHKTVFYSFFFIVLSNFIYAQHNIKNYNIKDGLSNYKVQSIFKDKDGFVWIGTQDGLNRFDGTNFKIFRNNPNDPNSISDGNILSITQDKEGLLWIAIDGGGVNVLNPLTDKITKFFDGIEFERSQLQYVKDIYIDKKDIVWISTWGGLIRYNKKKNCYSVFKHISTKNSISNTDVKSVIADAKENLWIATSNGLNYLDTKTMRFTNYFAQTDKPSIPDNSIRYLFLDTSDKLWIGTNGNLTSFDTKTNTFYNYRIDPNNNRSNIVNKIYEDKQQRLWICTEEGIYSADIKNKPNDEIYFNNSKITTQDSNSIFEDEDSQLWFGTRNKGFYILNRKKLKIQSIYYENKHPISKQTRSIIKGENNSIWFGSYNNGIINYNTETKSYQRYLHDSPLKDSKIETLQIDSQKNMWIGTFLDGLYHYNFKTEKLHHVIERSVINCTYEHNDHTVWVGTDNGILFYDLNRNKIEKSPYRIPKVIYTDYIYFIETDSQKNIWIGTMHNGVYKINPNITTITNYDYKKDPKTDRYSFITFYEDNNRIYYLGTRNGGLIKIYPNGKITNISTQNGIISNTVTGIINDTNNNLWLSTAKGICLIRNTVPKTYQSFDESDGVASYEFYRNSVYQDDNGTIFFGGTEGISYFQPEAITQKQNNQPAIISGCSVYNKPFQTDTIIPFKKKITLDYKENFLNFQFSSIGFYQPKKFQYKYRLQGLDEKWINATTERAVSYTNLQPGEYTFMVKSTNNHGIWNTTPAALKIKILPPFWRTWWFYSLLLISTVAGLFYFIKRREKQLVSDKEIAQFKLQALRSQMNPHFIFNSLNSIQYFIIKNENRFALDYLSKFSKLVRKILENSNQDRISLTDEIHFLENYIEIESLRFDKEIKYKIDLSEDLEYENPEIPSMLIQPYVENAIIHGLMNLKKELDIEGFIAITFKKVSNTLQCTISDNGVGRQASQEINSRVKKSHQSLGLSITKKRLETLNNSNESSITVSTEDIIAPSGAISGTKISIFIPLD